MSKARDLADFISTGSILSDGTLETVEINGVTATPEEVNKLDGVTVTTDEINYLSGASSAIQTQINNKAPISSPTFTGTATTPTLDATASVQLNGTEIVDSTRQLKNIASVDATTVSALSTAGAGLPSQTGNGGFYLTTDGSTATWAAVAAGGALFDGDLFK